MREIFSNPLSNLGEPSYVMDDTTRKAYDILVASLLSMEENRGLFVTGQEMSGKSFLISCLTRNAEKTTAKMERPYVFVNERISESLQSEEIEQGLRDYAQKMRCGLDQLVVLTTKVIVAYVMVQLKIGVRVVCEVENHELGKAFSQIPLAGWKVLDLDTFRPDHSSVVDALHNCADSIERKFGTSFSSEEILEFLECLYTMIARDLQEEGTLDDFASKAPLGVWATAFWIAAVHVAVNQLEGEYRLIEVIDTNETIYSGIWSSIEFDQARKNRVEGSFNSANQGKGKEQGFVEALATGENNNAEQDEPPKGYTPIDELAERLSFEVLGQEDALRKVIDGLTIPIANLHNDQRPVRSMIFLGPTGVGKTKLVETIAKNLYTEEVPLIRIDMSEYADKHSTNKLFGSPPGYIGYGDDGPLVNGLKKNPYSIVLMDEAEKADPAVWDAMLHPLDNGFLTTGSGERIDMRHSVIILTSNLGTNEIGKSSIGFGSPYDSEKNKNAIVTKAMKDYFRLEFINRINDVVVFNKLNDEFVYKIAEREIGYLGDRAKRSGFTLSKPSVGVINNVIKDANVAQYGAREIQRLVDTNLSLKVARAMTNTAKEGNHLVLSAHNGDIRVSKKKTTKG